MTFTALMLGVVQHLRPHQTSLTIVVAAGGAFNFAQGNPVVTGTVPATCLG